MGKFLPQSDWLVGSGLVSHPLPGFLLFHFSWQFLFPVSYELIRGASLTPDQLHYSILVEWEVCRFWIAVFSEKYFFCSTLRIITCKIKVFEHLINYIFKRVMSLKSSVKAFAKL